jgi:hypothetical protein
MSVVNTLLLRHTDWDHVRRMPCLEKVLGVRVGCDYDLTSEYGMYLFLGVYTPHPDLAAACLGFSNLNSNAINL